MALYNISVFFLMAIMLTHRAACLQTEKADEISSEKRLRAKTVSDDSVKPTLKVYGLYGPRKHYAWHIRHEVLLYLQHSVWEKNDGPEKPQLDIETLHIDDFRSKLKDEKIEPGSLVVVSERMAELSSPYMQHFDRKSQFDFRCYLSGNALLHYPLLQEIIAYQKPLQIFWTEDLRCSLNPSELPEDFAKHHRMYFVGSPCAAVAEHTKQSGSALSYFPIGLSIANDRVAYSESQGTPDNPVEDFMAYDAPLASQRPLLFAFRGSTGGAFAKPRRVALLDSLSEMLEKESMLQMIEQGNFQYLIEVPDMKQANAAFVQRENTYAYSSYVQLLADSVFTLSPAGDTYDTYRTFEAAAKGSIPVVEELDEFRNCKSPASAYRALGAPFLYVKSWDDLPAALSEALADGHIALDQWQQKLMSWYEDLQVKYQSEIQAFYYNATVHEPQEAPMTSGLWSQLFSIMSGTRTESHQGHSSSSWRCSASTIMPEEEEKQQREAKACALQRYKQCFGTVNKYGGCCTEVETCRIQPPVTAFACASSNSSNSSI